MFQTSLFVEIRYDRVKILSDSIALVIWFWILIDSQSQLTCFYFNAPVAQLDRAAAFEAVGQRFESSRVRHYQS